MANVDRKAQLEQINARRAAATAKLERHRGAWEAAVKQEQEVRARIVEEGFDPDTLDADVQALDGKIAQRLGEYEAKVAELEAQVAKYDAAVSGTP